VRSPVCHRNRCGQVGLPTQHRQVPSTSTGATTGCNNWIVIRDNAGQRQRISTGPKFVRTDTCKMFIYCELQVHHAQRKQVESPKPPTCLFHVSDNHLLSETPKSPHRRLSLCSLPVPKQTEGSLWSCLRRPARHLRDLAACAPSNPDVFHSREGFHAAALPLNFPVSTKSCFLRSTASM
jgi:hypothetical protein